ncbi:MAG: Rnase Y domain-containing protein, partial [Gemmatimonadaceae bacterium]
MDFTAIWAAGAILVLVAGCGLFFIVGRRAGTKGEEERQRVAGATAEQTAKRIVGDAERDAQSLRKTAVLEGKEELIRLREEWEAEARKRREDVEGDERRLQERTATIERKAD